MLSIFRYPGGKSKVRLRILRLAPEAYAEFREPFVGGGGVFFGTPPVARWINDVHPGLIAVYHALRDRPAEFAAKCRAIPCAKKCVPGTGKGRNHAYQAHELQQAFCEAVVREDADEALRYFVLQRCSLMGRVVYGDAQRTCFTSPEGWDVVKGDRLERASEVLQGVRITQGDFEPLFSSPGEYTWVFADPPYIKDTLAAERSKLYQFSFTMADHERLADMARRCQHRVLLSYDDDPKGVARSLYRGFDIVEESWVYGGATSTTKKVGRELLLANYDLRSPEILARLNQNPADVAA